jgi:hypothetical protein
MSKFTHVLEKEIREIIPPMVYFFFALSLIAIIRRLMLEGTGLPAGTVVQLLVAALIMGKAVLLADMLPFINRYPGKPLIYNVAWKTLIYLLVASAIHYVERIIEFWRSHGSFRAANQALLDTAIWPHIVAVEIIIGILVIAYCTFTELERVLGGHNMRAIFFGHPPKEIVLEGGVLKS